MSMSRERWVGYIKEYDGGTLMECSINMHVDYTQLKNVLKRQREVNVNIFDRDMHLSFTMLALSRTESSMVSSHYFSALIPRSICS